MVMKLGDKGPSTVEWITVLVWKHSRHRVSSKNNQSVLDNVYSFVATVQLPSLIQFMLKTCTLNQKKKN